MFVESLMRSARLCIAGARAEFSVEDKRARPKATRVAGEPGGFEELILIVELSDSTKTYKRPPFSRPDMYTFV
jgi:hypothetical protein